MKMSPVGFALLGVIAYLSYHAIAGEQGLSQWSRLQEEIKSLENQKAGLLEKRRELLVRIENLSDENLNHDLVEELARQKFHFVYPGELILEPPEFTFQPPKNEDLFALSN